MDQWIGQSSKQTAIPGAIDAGKRVKGVVTIDLGEEEPEEPEESEAASDGDGELKNEKEGAAGSEKETPLQSRKRKASNIGAGETMESEACSPALAAKARSAERKRRVSDLAEKGKKNAEKWETAVKEEKPKIKTLLKMKGIDGKMAREKSGKRERQSPSAAAKEFVTGMEKVVRTLVKEMREERQARQKLENRKLDLLFRKMGFDVGERGSGDAGAE